MSETIHHSSLGVTPHIAEEIAEYHSVQGTTNWDEVTCKVCLTMKPRMMTLHVEGCPGGSVENLDCSCPRVPVAGW